MPGSSACDTWRQAAENRSCQVRRCSREAGCSSRGWGSISATTTTTGRPEGPAERRHVLLDVRLLARAAHQQVAQEVALVLVLDRRHRALPGDEQGGHDGHPLEGVHVLLGDRPVEPHADQPGQVGAAGGHPQRAHLALPEQDAPSSLTRSTRIRPVASTSRASSSAARASSLSAEARSRPSVEVNSTPTPSTSAASAAICPRSPPSRTRWVRAVCSASTRAPARLGGRAPSPAVNT